MIWSDHETDRDLLGYRHLVDVIFNLTESPHLLPATIGVFGDWGSGKSSLLKMVSSKLSQNKDNLVLTFNGWLFEGYDDAKAALMETILDEISRRAKLTVKAKRLILSLLGRVKWLRVLGTGLKIGAGFVAAGPAGLAAVSGMEIKELVEKAAEAAEVLDDQKVEDYFKKEDQAKSLRRGIREFRKEFGELLKETKIKTLVVIIDDLDRCLPDTIIETLEAIKLFLFVENSAFILGADERLIKYAVRRRFPELPGEKVEVGRDYLEKLIQYPIRIPSLGRSEMETYIALLFLDSSKVEADKIEAVHAWCNSAETIQSDRAFGYTSAKQILKEIPPELEEHLILSEQLAPLLATGLNGNPRQCKRFLNTLILRLQMAESRGIKLSRRILAKLMLLEYFRPETFRLLAQMQAMQLGLPNELSMIESKIFSEDKAATGLEAGKAGTKSDDGAGDTLLTKKVLAPTLPANVQTWIEDSFVGGWLLLEPRLAKIDLRPYFYFSRDILGAIGGAAKRLSPRAQDVLIKLINDSEAIKGNALKDAKNLDSSEAASIFEELAERIRKDDDLSKKSSPLNLMVSWVGVRPELINEFLILLQQLPEAVLPFSILPKVKKLTKDTPSQATATTLMERWSKSSVNPQLQKAAIVALR
jgi:hypothetical protein